MAKMSLKFFIFASIFTLFFACRDSINNPPNSSNGLEPPPEFGPGLTVISPASGDNWIPGSSHEIRWDVAENEFKIDILLYRKTEFKMVIAESIDNTGSYIWQVPLGLPESHHYRIHFIYSFNPFQRSFVSDEFFVIQQ